MRVRRVIARGLLLCVLPCAGLFHMPTASARRRETAVVAPSPTFREDALKAMEAAFGGKLKTHQDAINSAYLAVGWKWGATTEPKFDDLAFRKARSWGFRIEELAQDRGAPFLVVELAQGPLSRDSARLAARATKRARRIAKRDKTSQPPPYPGPLFAPPSEEERRLSAVSRRIDEVQAELRRIEAELDDVEESVLAKDVTVLEHAAELQRELENLAGMLDASQRSVGDIDADIRSMARTLGMR